jgi:hypothetical protein
MKLWTLYNPSVFLNFNISLVEHSSMHVTIGAFFARSSQKISVTLVKGKKWSWRWPGGSRGCRIRPTFHLNVLSVGQLGTREWAVGHRCLPGVHSTIFCTSPSYFTTARPIGHVVQCETEYIRFLESSFDLVILNGISLLMSWTWELAFRSIYLHCLLNLGQVD